MDVDRFCSDEVSRRSFFQSAGVVCAGSSAVFVASCGSGETMSTSTSRPVVERDIEVLNGALALEHTAVAAYTAGAPLLKGPVLALGRRLLTHEQDHAAALKQAIESMGATPVKPKSSYDFPALQTQTDVLRFANELEHVAVAAYVDALPRLSSPGLRGTAAAIVTSEAEHVAVLLGALGRLQTPTALVSGVPR